MSEQICGACKQPRSAHTGIGEPCPVPTPTQEIGRARALFRRAAGAEGVCGQCGYPRDKHTGIGERCPV